jgi:hypothetical protein
MLRIKAFFIVLAIIVTAVTCFSGIALGARPYQMDKWNGHVFIDGGEDQGFILGATVCFPSCSGKGFICGTVLKTSPSEAMVKVDNTATKTRDICGEAILYVGEKPRDGEKEMIENEEEEDLTKEKERINNKDWFQ